jgi:hypothetical protein
VTTLKDIMEVCGAFDGVEAEKWINELTEMVAKRVCKSRPDLPAWTKLSPAERNVCRTSAKKHLEAIALFFQTKLDEEKNG